MCAPERRLTHFLETPPTPVPLWIINVNDDDGGRKVVLESSSEASAAGCKGGPEVQEWFDGIESLVPRDLAC